MCVCRASKQKIGTVLVSKSVIPYEQQKVAESGVEQRGTPIAAGSILLSRFSNIYGWQFPSDDGGFCDTQVGQLLSGEKLVNDAKFKESLFDAWPKAIGGEMEGAGVAAAASRKNCEWIVVKAICDWADGTKSDDYQKFAAMASLDLVKHVLNQPKVLADLIGKS